MLILGDKVFKAASISMFKESNEKKSQIIKEKYGLHDGTDKNSKKISRNYKKDPKGNSRPEE